MFVSLIEGTHFGPMQRFEIEVKLFTCREGYLVACLCALLLGRIIENMSQAIILHRYSFSNSPRRYTLDTFAATQNGG